MYVLCTVFMQMRRSYPREVGRGVWGRLQTTPTAAARWTRQGAAQMCISYSHCSWGPTPSPRSTYCLDFIFFFPPAPSLPRKIWAPAKATGYRVTALWSPVGFLLIIFCAFLIETRRDNLKHGIVCVFFWPVVVISFVQ